LYVPVQACAQASAPAWQTDRKYTFDGHLKTLPKTLLNAKVIRNLGLKCVQRTQHAGAHLSKCNHTITNIKAHLHSSKT
jgi:hypothetical protein